MLSNAYFLANFCFDKAENEPAKNLQNLPEFWPNFANFATPNPLMRSDEVAMTSDRDPLLYAKFRPEVDVGGRR